MRILLVNKFFYPRGGDCVVAMTTRELLLEKGHEVRIFSMKYPENILLPESETFAEEVSFNGGIDTKLKSAKRLFGIDNVKTAFNRVLDEFRPDIVHLHNIHSYLSPIIGELAHQRGIRVVWTLHDYKIICPAYNCRRNDGENCDQCLQGSHHVVLNRCMKGSMARSMMAYLESLVWNKRRLERSTDLFIAPSRFIFNKMMEAGFSRKKLTVISNFIDPKKLDFLQNKGLSFEMKENVAEEDYFCYVGRLSEEKGVITLLEAAVMADVRLRIAGDGPLLESLKRKYGSNGKIEFLGRIDSEGVTRLLQGARASVIPSECFENNPLSAIESLCCGTPVIGASIGGIPELITPETGITFTSGNAEELAGILRTFRQRDSFNRDLISEKAINRFSKESYYDSLINAYMD